MNHNHVNKLNELNHKDDVFFNLLINYFFNSKYFLFIKKYTD